jgi:spore coat protein H
LFNDMRIAAPRSAFAKLYVNDTLWGLFCVVEEIDGRFTKSHYPASGDGNLYKDIWPIPPLTDQAVFDALVTNNDSSDNPDISDFAAFRDTVTASGTDSANFREKMRTIVDIQHLARYLAVDRGIMNFDGIMSNYAYGIGMRHNYCWYHDQESGLFKLIPWDLDKVLLYPEPNFWTNNEPNGNNIIPNWNVINTTYTTYACTFDPGSSGGGYMVKAIDSDKFLRLLRNTAWKDFTAQSRIFLDSFFVENKINGRIGKWRDHIAAAVGEDPLIDSAEWSTMVDSLSHTIPLFRKNLELMIDTLIVR